LKDVVVFSTRTELASLVELFMQRQASLWHACQLIDLGAYLKVGGIPSRSLVERSRLSITPFDTDGRDRVNDVWDKVFLNLSDFGTMFWSGRRAVPNPYGPIAFQLQPKALLTTSDVALCLRSAGARGFDRTQEGLRTVDEVDRVFLHSRNAPYPEAAEVRHGHRLQEEFIEYGDTARSCEMSLTIPGSLLPFRNVLGVWVDPITVHGRQLLDRVTEDVTRAGYSWPVHTRYTDEDRRAVFAELISIVGAPRTRATRSSARSSWHIAVPGRMGCRNPGAGSGVAVRPMVPIPSIGNGPAAPV